MEQIRRFTRLLNERRRVIFDLKKLIFYWRYVTKVEKDAPIGRPYSLKEETVVVCIRAYASNLIHKKQVVFVRSDGVEDKVVNFEIGKLLSRKKRHLKGPVWLLARLMVPISRVYEERIALT